MPFHKLKHLTVLTEGRSKAVHTLEIELTLNFKQIKPPFFWLLYQIHKVLDCVSMRFLIFCMSELEGVGALLTLNIEFSWLDLLLSIGSPPLNRARNFWSVTIEGGTMKTVLLIIPFDQFIFFFHSTGYTHCCSNMQRSALHIQQLINVVLSFQKWPRSFQIAK